MMASGGANSADTSQASRSVIRRNRPGSKAADLWNWGVEDIAKMKGPFAV